MRSCLFITVLALAIAGCGNKSDRDKNPADKVSYDAKDDPIMNAAMEKARASVKIFIAALNNQKLGQSGFSVKMAFSDGENTEHMWLSPVTFDGTAFTGTVNNDPEKVKTVKIGQKASVTPDKISDWMYIDNGKLVGGETMRAMRATMSPADRAVYDKSVPFTFD